MSEIRIFQGNQIGGCVTVISTVYKGEMHRIMIDYGSSLPGSGREEDFQYPWKDEPVDAVFFTHYHGDHSGRLMEIPEDIPLYMGATARRVMLNIHEALGKSEKVEDAAEHRKEAALLNDKKRVHEFKRKGSHYETIKLPGFSIEPYSVDHSAYDAYMFLIEADENGGGKYRILHTGDFRGHGRRGKVMLPIIESYVHRFGDRKVDALVIEGTMMSRSGERVMSETEMQIEAAKYLHQHKWAFLICSSTNLDSLASFYQAAQMTDRRYGRYMYVYSEYFRKQLELFTKTAGSFTDVYEFEKVKRLSDMDKIPPGQKTATPMTQREMMEKFGFLAIIKPEDFCEAYIDMFVDAYKEGRIDEPPVLIYSMWEGYVREYLITENGGRLPNKAKNDQWISFLQRQEKKGVEINYLHTSGHASVKVLTDVINAVDPQDKIYPMHTECAEDFKELAIKEELKDRIVIEGGYNNGI
ncbi:MAG: MBL fold metallo-hydrolase [Lachnospiraceae bacterium]|nr:MBL fold metallo-hydrolase [Lachnospiraceae bacterium]